ncbi:uncharacterized protein F4812DRAFT_457110 [Daldinia caldariorum]|uniref:uncharacterized protein n=1 Tax=Daldinia caldariorum TaxID=326644 RepID=UPI002008386F|nr:uncharacterized protein F4812DRAFT_457110 [Daldinia caldariorum]KAI1469708.1 hypothetical protein F4812DRAFT_457110 [Daldinia caldariorum]
MDYISRIRQRLTLHKRHIPSPAVLFATKLSPGRLLGQQAERWAGITVLALILQLQVFLWRARVVVIAEEIGNVDDKGFGAFLTPVPLLARRTLSLFAYWAFLSTYGVFFAAANKVYKIVALVLGSILGTIVLLPLFALILVAAFLL